MAKKKRRRHRRPVAPPVHSAPGTVHGPAGPPPSESPPTRPYTPEPPTTAAEPAVSTASARSKQAARRRPTSRRKRGPGRTYAIIAAIVLLLVGAFVVRSMFNNRRVSNFNNLAASAGCGKLRVTDSSGANQHLAEGQTATYDGSPPTHGAHARTNLTAGVYDDPFTNVPIGDKPTIFQAVHSLEHGYIIVWHEGLSDEQERSLERKYRDEKKVIVVPYPQLRGDTKVAMTAWGRIVRCERPSTPVIDEFVELFREARSAPEPKQA